ncbi:MAG TPA: flagellar export protein FliJ [Terriglobales bacterium]|nr:flagellar export protein FliJ [Terriglobales bacterium]
MSARFTFRLARVLRHRRRLEDVRARAVREAVERRARAQAHAEALGHATDAARAALGGACADGIPAGTLQDHARAVLDLGRLTEAAAQVTATAAQEAESRRVTLVAAAQERQMLERLEAIQRAAWQASLRRADQRTTDEIATTRGRRT